jgi:tRNA-2-methylthio-N6-dimethylallyladenosine synthase
VLTGCSVRTDNVGTLHRRYPQVDLFLRPDEEPELTSRLGLAGATAPGRMATAVRRESHISAWLPVIYGCDKTCTYCIVPFSRGPERSRPFDDVVNEARSLAAEGYHEITLLGQNVNSYGHDLPIDDRFAHVRRARDLGRDIDLDGRPDIAELLRAIDSLRTADGVHAISRLRFVTSHPWDLSDRLIAAMAESDSVCEHLHLPVQSGDDAVLKRMGRQYTIDAYVRLVEKLRAAIPSITLTTDIIVGFCGETEPQFENTLALLREVQFETVFAAAFSVRPGTPAARLEDDVTRADKKRRLQTLLDAQETIGRVANEKWVGRTTDVLVDQQRPPSSHSDAPAQPGIVRLAGRNRNNKLVHFDGRPELIGQIVDVRVGHAGPYALSGSLDA